MKQKIVFIVPALIKCGPIIVVYNLVKCLDKKRFTPVIVSLYEHDLEKRKNRNCFEQLGVEIIDLHLSKGYIMLHLSKVAHEIDAYFTRENAIYHAHGYLPTLILSKFKSNNTIVTIHNICFEDFIMRRGRLKGGFMSYTYEHALVKINRCVAISDTMRNRYIMRNSRLRLSTVYNGVNMVNVTTVEQKREVRNRLNLPLDKIVLLYPATFSSCKNQTALIRAVKQCKRSDLLILFAGQGSTFEECKRLAANDCRIRFLGYCMDMDIVWKSADYMISASKSEGLPMAVLEALLHGLPCILSDIPPHREVIERIWGDSSSLCFSIDNDIKLIQCLSILTIASEMTPLTPEDISDRAKRFYSSQSMARGYEDIYDDLVK